MSGQSPAGAPPTQMDQYTRNGFAGPATAIIRTQYTPTYSRVEGDYVPLRFDIGNWETADAADRRAMPTPLLDGGDVRVDLWRRHEDTPFAARDVRHDQLFYVLHGNARLETDFGVLDLIPHDLVRLPRSVSYRLRHVRDLLLVIMVSAQAQYLNLDDAGMLNLATDLDTPRPYDGPPEPGQHELVLCHGTGRTSYFYDYDPLHMLATRGAPAVQRFNFLNVHPANVAGIGAPPGRLMVDESTRSALYYLGARESARPPVHHNADYDEVVLYTVGPGAFGEMKQPGALIFVPKGVIHQGPEENVPEGYVAWLLETRADLAPTAAGRETGVLAETSLFGRHPSRMQTVGTTG